jgi:hypothetical protein
LPFPAGNSNTRIGAIPARTLSPACEAGQGLMEAIVVGMTDSKSEGLICTNADHNLWPCRPRQEQIPARTGALREEMSNGVE